MLALACGAACMIGVSGRLGRTVAVQVSDDTVAQDGRGRRLLHAGAARGQVRGELRQHHRHVRVRVTTSLSLHLL